MAWIGFCVAQLVFFLSHYALIRPPLRPVLQRRLGKGGFSVFYSAVSVGLLAWVIREAKDAPHITLWAWAPWQSAVTLALMLAACLVFGFAIGRANPFSFGGGADAAYVADRPGLIRITRHPILAGLGLWAAAHLVANGDLAHALMFGTFLAFAAGGGRLIDRRKCREDPALWNARRAELSKQPIWAEGWSEHRPVLRASLAVAAWICLIAVHPLVLGVDPLWF